MRNISIVTNETSGEKAIIYCHSDEPGSINLEVNEETYKEIQEMSVGNVKKLINNIIIMKWENLQKKEKKYGHTQT